MDMTYRLISEDNKQILEMIKQLDEKIFRLKQENRLPVKYLQAITEFYQEAVLPWMQNYELLDREIDPEAEQEVTDKIYELFLLLQALED
jgi:hypothetical protein